MLKLPKVTNKLLPSRIKLTRYPKYPPLLIVLKTTLFSVFLPSEETPLGSVLWGVCVCVCVREREREREREIERECQEVEGERRAERECQGV